MHLLGFALLVVGGAWAIAWAIEQLLHRHGIAQAFGSTRTPRERNEAEERGVQHQERMLDVLSRGLWFALLLAAGGIVLLALAD